MLDNPRRFADPAHLRRIRHSLIDRAQAPALHVLVAVTILLALAAPAVADACSCRQSRRGRFVLGAGDTIPRDAPGIPWDGSGLTSYLGEPSPVTSFERHVGDTRVPIKFTLKLESHFEFIVPDGGMRPGDQFTVTVRETHGSQVDLTTATVTVGSASIALDGSRLVLASRHLGIVQQRPPAYTGECSVDAEADIVEVRVELPPAVERYREYLLYTTLIDGKPYVHPPASECGLRSRIPPGRSRLAPPGRELLFTTCDGAAGLASGTHEVALQISTPDRRQSFTPPAVTFELDCATSPRPIDPRTADPPAEPATPTPSIAEPPPVASPPATRGCTLASFPATWLPLLFILRRRRRLLPARSDV